MAIRDTYTKVHEDWVDLPDKSTPVYAEDLEHFEQGIKDAMDNRALKEIYDDYSINFGRLSGSKSGIFSVAAGSGVTASGDYSHAEGAGAIASAYYSHAEGARSSASAWASHAEGEGTEASGGASHAEGYYTKASGMQSHSEGCGTEASGDYSHAEGYGTKAENSYDHAEGYNTTASGENSHAEGASTIASAYYSHAEGDNTKASGNASHAEGFYTKAHGSFCHSEGYYTESGVQGSSVDSAHAEGQDTKARGRASHTEGVRTEATGEGSHAEGIDTTQLNHNARATHTEGIGTQAVEDAQHVGGKYNTPYGNSAVVIGGGTSDSDRKNIHTLDWQGNAYFLGDVRNGAGVSLNSLKSAIDMVASVAEGASIAKVFDTKSDLDGWLSVEGNPETLKIGQNIYILETVQPDYWWDGTGLQVLETDKVVIETLTYDETMAILNDSGEVA